MIPQVSAGTTDRCLLAVRMVPRHPDYGDWESGTLRIPAEKEDAAMGIQQFRKNTYESINQWRNVSKYILRVG